MPRDDLAATLRSLDGQSYGRYRSLSGDWPLGSGATLTVVRVQADPFAPPSRIRVRLPDAAPTELTTTPDRRRALSGFLLRRLRRALRGTPVHVDAGGPEVLERSAGRVEADGTVTVELGVPMPGPKRRILGREAATLLGETLPAAVAQLRWEGFPDDDRRAAREFVTTVEDAVALRAALAERRLVAFVADGAVLPRRSGVDDHPLEGATPFASPESLRVTIPTPNAGDVTGLGVPEGVTLIVGGGYHGKSTVLRAIEAGVYDHQPGDGRERVVARDDAVKVRAEDGRSVVRTDVSAFVTHLPSGQRGETLPTDDFSTTNASGSTSQAASMVEAVEAGAGVLLVDEDTSATNIMIRDGRMQQLIATEPLVPFVERIRPLHAERGVSSVLVMGGSGDYLEVADTVIMMDSYACREVTGRAHEIAAQGRTRAVEHSGFPPVTRRVVDPSSLDPTGRQGKRRVTARGVDTLTFGEDDVDLSAVEQIVDRSQVTGIGRALALLGEGVLDGTIPLGEGLDLLDAELGRAGVDALLGGGRDATDLAVPRRHEVAAALNRLRTVKVRELLRGAP
ncbi:ABC-ATPase domain-containing protein [Actinomycetospora sp. TBRC 11914]|uniref:ABC-ATPase domain-containing protein n=1 Tax=Actinomycetospora sp. TBRC 11914 TaxID=2729387 RepID=UPI00145F0DE8|nr:ABC-ATPase domain-containing protein [Actinomycetospora sp. TBRC 11914]NMO90716.1 ABC-ATPase domain-containing protein [Actinomycetospora sp. TBRC 11914]